ncbi:hypothetical protein PMIN02_004857 [Paraphaeosphaeria minitans]
MPMCVLRSVWGSRKQPCECGQVGGLDCFTAKKVSEHGRDGGEISHFFQAYEDRDGLPTYWRDYWKFPCTQVSVACPADAAAWQWGRKPSPSMAHVTSTDLIRQYLQTPPKFYR